MAGFCKVTLVGELQAEPRMTTTSNGRTVCRLRVGVARVAFGNQSQGSSEPVVDQYSVGIWGSNAEEVNQRAQRGEIQP
ncbi:MAG: single-stranded DNA-binding protein, partial [Thermomicrobiales bacterium]